MPNLVRSILLSMQSDSLVVSELQIKGSYLGYPAHKILNIISGTNIAKTTSI